MSDAPRPQNDLDRLGTLHAAGDLTDEEFEAAKRRLQAPAPGAASSLTTKFEAISRGETPFVAPSQPADTANYNPQVVAAGAAPKKGPPIGLILLIVAAVLVVIIAAVVAA